MATETASKPTKKGKNKEQKDNDDADDTTKRTSSSSRICDGCKRMETPGEDIREAIKQQLISEIARLEKRSRKKEARERPAIRNQFEETMDRASMNIAVKVADAIGKAGMEIAPVVPLLLHRGFAFSTNEGEENDEYDRPERMHGTTPPSSGYLEITNKSSVFFCIKILCSGGRDSNRLKFEVPRPSFIAVPPGGTVHAFFDDKKGPTKGRFQPSCCPVFPPLIIYTLLLINREHAALGYHRLYPSYPLTPSLPPVTLPGPPSSASHVCSPTSHPLMTPQPLPLPLSPTPSSSLCWAIIVSLICVFT